MSTVLTVEAGCTVSAQIAGSTRRPTARTVKCGGCNPRHTWRGGGGAARPGAKTVQGGQHILGKAGAPRTADSRGLKGCPVGGRSAVLQRQGQNRAPGWTSGEVGFQPWEWPLPEASAGGLPPGVEEVGGAGHGASVTSFLLRTGQDFLMLIPAQNGAPWGDGSRGRLSPCPLFTAIIVVPR